MLHFLLAQLQEDVDRKVRILLYVMLGLIMYFIVDRGHIMARGTYDTQQGRYDEALDTVEMGTAMASQIPTVQNEIETLKKQISTNELADQGYRNQILHCNESLLLNQLKKEQTNDSVFKQFRVRKGEVFGDLEEYVYQVNMEGPFLDILELLNRIDRSKCFTNVNEWSLTLSDKQQNIVTGVLTLVLYKEKKSS